MSREFKTPVEAPSVTLGGKAVGPLADTGTPADLGTASRGTSDQAARADHVHNSAGGGGGGVNDATYVTLSTNGTLTDERVLTAGGYITVTDGGAGSTVTVAVDATSANTVSKVVARDASGNFSAGTITASLTGTASGNVPNGRTITATSPITIAGTTSADLSADRTIAINDGTTAAKGAVQLEDSTSSTSTTKAATPNSVKTAYDLANAAIPKSTVTTAGDLIVATGSGTVTRLAIGANDYVLTSNGTTATWAAASGGGGGSTSVATLVKWGM